MLKWLWLVGELLQPGVQRPLDGGGNGCVCGRGVGTKGTFLLVGKMRDGDAGQWTLDTQHCVESLNVNCLCMNR